MQKTLSRDFGLRDDLSLYKTLSSQTNHHHRPIRRLIEVLTEEEEEEEERKSVAFSFLWSFFVFFLFCVVGLCCTHPIRFW